MKCTYLYICEWHAIQDSQVAYLHGSPGHVEVVEGIVEVYVTSLVQPIFTLQFQQTDHIPANYGVWKS